MRISHVLLQDARCIGSLAGVAIATDLVWVVLFAAYFLSACAARA